MQILFFIILCTAVAATIAVHWIFIPILKFARAKGLVDRPDMRKLQKTPVPVLGGVAVFFGMMVGMTLFSTLYYVTGAATDGIMENLIPLFLGTCVMSYMGLMDDIIGLSPKLRLLIECLVVLCVIYGSGTCIDSLHGLWGVREFSWWIGVPLTIFSVVGIINAYNAVDGVNGLSSGLGIACSFIFGLIGWKMGYYANCALALCYAGSLMPFLLHNVFGKKSKMFIGDSGTMVMGLQMAWFVICILSSNNTDSLISMAGNDRELGSVAMVLSVCSVPIFDMLRVITARVQRGESPLHADMTHLHHAFIAVGVSHSITALCEIVINLTVVGLLYITYACGCSNEVQLYVTVGAAVVLVWGTYWFLSSQGRKGENAHSALQAFAKWSHLGHTNGWLKLQSWLDKDAYES